MISKSRRSSTAKIEVISSVWSVLIFAMLATTVTLYETGKSAPETMNSQVTMQGTSPHLANLR